MFLVGALIVCATATLSPHPSARAFFSYFGSIHPHLLLAPPPPTAQELLHSLPRPLSWPAWQRYHALAHRLFGFDGPPLPFARFCTLSCERFGPGWRDHCVDQRDFDALWQPIRPSSFLTTLRNNWPVRLFSNVFTALFPSTPGKSFTLGHIVDSQHSFLCFRIISLLASTVHTSGSPPNLLAPCFPMTLLLGLPPLLVCCLLLLPAPWCLASTHGVSSAAAARLSAMFSAATLPPCAPWSRPPTRRCRLLQSCHAALHRVTSYMDLLLHRLQTNTHAVSPNSLANLRPRPPRHSHPTE